MPFPCRQNPWDWATQYWNILLGQRLDPVADDWLAGPIGAIGEDSEQFLNRITHEHNLRIDKNSANAGLLASFAPWNLALRPEIELFYLHTSDYDLEVETAWRPVFGSLGFLVSKLFSRRIQQLNLPQNDSKTPIPIQNEVIHLRDHDNRRVMTLWRRTRADRGEIIFYGIYTTCQLPSGEVCIKAIFPLPQGNATVIFQLQSDARGNLELLSSGNSDGDPGFYFLVKDSDGLLWKHYLRDFRERIHLSVNESNSTLKAEHTLTLWSLPVYRMIYTISKKSQPAPP